MGQYNTLLWNVCILCIIVITFPGLTVNPVAQVLPNYEFDAVTHSYTSDASNCSGTSVLPSPSFVTTQRARQSQLSDVCRQQSSISGFHPVSVSQLSNILVDDQHKVMYCAIPKVGCSNWKRMFVHLIGEHNLTLKETSKLKVHESSVLSALGIQRLSEFSKEDIIHRLSTYYKFLFVRDPLERLLSAYKDKFSTYNKYTRYFQHRYGRAIIRKYRKNPSDVSLLHGHDVTFSEFINYVIHLGNKTGEFNPHWRQYSSLCFPCNIGYNFIGHMESMKDDSQYVLGRILSSSCPPEFPSSHKRTSDVRTQEFYSQISRSHINQLKNIYRTDIDLFGYQNQMDIL